MMFRSGFAALLRKEVLRFLKVSFQTLAAPVLTTYLYLLIFSHVLQSHVKAYFDVVPYTAFLVPGLAMMAILQNAFANSSSSIIQSKMTGNIIFLLLSPLRPAEMFFAYALAAVFRGLLVGIAVLLLGLFMTPLTVHSWSWVLLSTLLGGALFGCLGIIAGLWSDRFDQLAAFQNFLIVPMTFLSGVFYSLHDLSPFWQHLSHYNPVFYIIDSFRYGFFGLSDISPWTSMGVTALFVLLVGGWTWWLLRTGYKLRP